MVCASGKNKNIFADFCWKNLFQKNPFLNVIILKNCVEAHIVFYFRPGLHNSSFYFSFFCKLSFYYCESVACNTPCLFLNNYRCFNYVFESYCYFFGIAWNVLV